MLHENIHSRKPTLRATSRSGCNVGCPDGVNEPLRSEQSDRNKNELKCKPQCAAFISDDFGSVNSVALNTALLSSTYVT